MRENLKDKIIQNKKIQDEGIKEFNKELNAREFLEMILKIEREKEGNMISYPNSSGLGGYGLELI